MVAGEIPATDSGMDADLEYDPGTVADAARDNGIAPDAFAETTGDNGIAPDAFVDIPPAGIETEDASPQDRGESPIAPDDFSGHPHRSTIGTLRAFWRGAGLTPVARRRGDPAQAKRPQDASSGRAEGPGFHPAFAAPHAGRPDGPDNSAGPFHPARRRLCGLDLEPVKSTGMVSAHPSAKPRGHLDRPRACSILPKILDDRTPGPEHRLRRHAGAEATGEDAVKLVRGFESKLVEVVVELGGGVVVRLPAGGGVPEDVSLDAAEVEMDQRQAAILVGPGGHDRLAVRVP